MTPYLVEVASGLSAFICFAAASQNRSINKRIEEVNDELTQKHPGTPHIHSAYYYSLLFVGILQLVIFVVSLLQK